jgi:hypothetical protein
MENLGDESGDYVLTIVRQGAAMSGRQTRTPWAKIAGCEIPLQDLSKRLLCSG